MVRVRVLGNDAKRGIEARFAQLADRRLLYISNFNPQPAILSVDGPSGPAGALTELRSSTVVQRNQITVPAHQTGIYEFSK